MISAKIYDDFGYCVGEPKVPDSPLPGVVIWGEETFVRVEPAEDGTPQYRRSLHYVVTETRKTPVV